MKKNALAVVTIIIAGMVLAACGPTTSTNTTTESTTKTSGAGAPAANQKSGDTTKTGVLSEAGGKFLLQEPGSTPQIVESYAVELKEYVGQTVTVTGQYSGDTLFIGKIE